MFAYCNNNPVVYADTKGNYAYYIVHSADTTVLSVNSDGSITYETTINYTYVTMNTDVLFAPEVRLDGEVVYQYFVDSRGVIIYDSRLDDGGELGDNNISTALAEEMYSVAITQVSGALSGRTISGIARELRMHQKWSFLWRNKFGIIDIGGLDESRTDYDYNAKMFENLWKTPAVLFEMIF